MRGWTIDLGSMDEDEAMDLRSCLEYALDEAWLDFQPFRALIERIDDQAVDVARRKAAGSMRAAG